MPRAQARERARVSSVQHRVWVALRYLGAGDGSFAMQGDELVLGPLSRQPLFLALKSSLKSACWRTAVPRGSQNGIYGMWAGSPPSLRLDVGRPDHLAPFLGFVGDELSKVGGRARQPTSARRALILGSVRPALISLLSMLTISAGVRRTRPPHRAQSHGRGLCGGSQPVVHRKGHRAASFNTSGFRFSARTGA